MNTTDRMLMVRDFHRKFKVLVSENPTLISADRSSNRYKLMKDEVEEYLQSVKEEDLVNIAKELADILYTVYGTILEHGLHDVIDDVFQEVHESNMSKEYGEYKMVKGEKYFKADVGKFFESD